MFASLSPPEQPSLVSTVTSKPHETRPPSDTSTEARRILDQAYRDMSRVDRWRLVGKLYAQSRALFAAGVRMRNSDATDADINDLWLRESLDPGTYQEVSKHVRRIS